MSLPPSQRCHPRPTRGHSGGVDRVPSDTGVSERGRRRLRRLPSCAAPVRFTAPAPRSTTPGLAGDL